MFAPSAIISLEASIVVFESSFTSRRVTPNLKVTSQKCTAWSLPRWILVWSHDFFLRPEIQLSTKMQSSMDGNAGLSFGPTLLDGNVSVTIWWFTMKFCKDSMIPHDPQWINGYWHNIFSVAVPGQRYSLFSGVQLQGLSGDVCCRFSVSVSKIHFLLWICRSRGSWLVLFHRSTLFASCLHIVLLSLPWYSPNTDANECLQSVCCFPSIQHHLHIIVF